MRQMETETIERNWSVENSRLATLESLDILDSPPESAYDVITRLAAEYFHADVSAICFADETRVWVKSHWGAVPRELPRDHSIFNAVLANNGPVVAVNPAHHPLLD